MPTIITSAIISNLEQEKDSPDCWLSGGMFRQGEELVTDYTIYL